MSSLYPLKSASSRILCSPGDNPQRSLLCPSLWLTHQNLPPLAVSKSKPSSPCSLPSASTNSPRSVTVPLGINHLALCVTLPVSYVLGLFKLLIICFVLCVPLFCLALLSASICSGVFVGRKSHFHRHYPRHLNDRVLGCPSLEMLMC